MREINWMLTANNIKRLRLHNDNLRHEVCKKLSKNGCKEISCENCNLLTADNQISARELADYLNFSLNIVTNIENGRTIPSAEFLLRIADLCNITIEEVLVIEGQKE